MYTLKNNVEIKIILNLKHLCRNIIYMRAPKQMKAEGNMYTHTYYIILINKYIARAI